MKPKKLQSGSYRIQVYAGKDANGKSMYESFTHPDKKEAQRLALEFKLHHKAISRDSAKMTVGEAIDKYIGSKDGVLSPTTIQNYKRMRKNCLQGIIDIPLRNLTQDNIQREINAMAKLKSPKYVRNVHGLLSATLAVYYPNLALRTTMPQKKIYEPNIPTFDDIKRIIDLTTNTDIELPVILALWFGLRISEIRGIEWNSIKGNVLYVKQAVVDTDKESILKTTKSTAGNRKLLLPPSILDLINRQPKNGKFVIALSGKSVYDRFTKICKKNGLPHFRFHDLRHANASVMLALGIPDKYAMERGGWATNYTMKNVYQHTMSEQRLEVDRKINSFFEDFISHEISHAN